MGAASVSAMQSIAFDPADARATLLELPQRPAVYALYGADPKDEPYVGRTPNLRGRLERLLQPSPKHPRRLQLAGRVRRIAWRLTGSEFESLLTQFSLLEEIYGAKALERMHLRAPAFVRYLGGNPYPRIGIRPRVGLCPKTPQKCAGTRIDPPMSDPIESGPNPTASAAADPPEEPPGERPRSHGLLVVP